MKRFFLAALFSTAGCATTQPTTPPSITYLLPTAAPQAQGQVEQIEGPWIFLRSGDCLLQVQAVRIAQAVGVRMIFVNLSNKAVRLEAGQITLTGADGGRPAQIKPEAVYQPLLDRAADLTARSKKKQALAKTADSVVNMGESYAGGSVSAADARIARAEADRLAQEVKKDPFRGALVNANHKLAGTLYFELPRAWPVTLRVQAGEETITGLFSTYQRPALTTR